MKHALVFLLLFTALAFGQTATTPPLPSAAPSTWFVGSGVAFNAYSKTYASPAYAPFVHVGGCWTSVCEITTIEFGAAAATVRQDIGYKMKSSADGGTMLIAIAGGSLTTTTGANAVIPTAINLGGVGGGFAVKVDPGVIPPLRSMKGKGLGVLAEVRVAAVSSLGVQPQIALSVNYRFR